ncbi:MAG: prepilin peptidase [Ruminococcaceae bacterium]|jgi:leader peptidase (prepilin peptidase)/N-methyltransferase|nr:prepilin peptidase [Oscillospiraceae bacterium]
MDFLIIQKIYLSVVIFLFGIVIGSFLNVLIYRLPIGLDFKKGSSFCPKCNHDLKWYDLIPLFSYIFLGGKCRYCKARISPQYPIVESLNGIMYVLAFLFLCDGTLKPELLGYCMILSCLIVLSWTDFQHNIIPDSMWICILIGGVEIYVCDIIKNGFNLDTLISKLIGLVLVSGILLILGLIFTKLKGVDAIGGGDIKLMAAAGFVLGWQSTVLATVVGTVVGLIFTVIYLSIIYKKEQKEKGVDPKAEKKKAKEEKAKAKQEAALAEPTNKIAQKVKAKRALENAGNEETAEEAAEEAIEEEDTGREVPFGPHLALGIAFALFFGQRILTWYFDMVVDGLMK